MSNELDPHHLVALMSHVFASTQDGSSRRLDTSSHNFKHGIVDNHTTNVRTLPILDAIANISVSRERSQSIAVALQLDSQKKEIRLTIAENQRVTKALLDHLCNVWGNLQTLSNEYAEQRTGASDQPMHMALTLKIQIFRDIYLYSLKKQMKRINKWFQNLGQFVKVLLNSRGSSNLQGFEVNLFDAVVALLTPLELVCKLHDNPQSQLTDEQWAQVYRLSMKANEHVRVVLADRGGTSCEVLAEELKGAKHLEKEWCLPNIV
ncbi:hypothetical protein L873DRAFT_1147938 [Choiromyces venosus 120613-1]|uniref:Uncharacterized protein n=1 Tax=Choiromyces venosus 120613-1 TaxID=1336337 RepID=A0A3N4JFQ6_9PEZI|nr:hypothetical protein L873DRAFT_1147938 [Choiromyces venosus 120613-1]